MTMPKAIFFGLTLIAFAVVWNTESVGQRKATGPGPYMLSASGGVGWRIHTYTGNVSRCRAESAHAKPKCGPWSNSR